jgi:hypothetical protein
VLTIPFYPLIRRALRPALVDEALGRRRSLLRSPARGGRRGRRRRSARISAPAAMGGGR